MPEARIEAREAKGTRTCWPLASRSLIELGRLKFLRIDQLLCEILLVQIDKSYVNGFTMALGPDPVF